MGIVDNALMGASGQSGYNLTRSLRFRSSASAYLSRTPASAGNRKTWTWSAWVKRGQLGVFQSIFSAFNGAANNDGIGFNANNKLSLYSASVGADVRVTTAVYRDPSAWYHIVVSSDTPNATAQSRARIWVNGSEVTAWDTNTTITQNSDWFFNSTNQHNIGRFVAGGYYDGYQTEINFIDGQALTPSSFGSTNTLTGVWQPAKYQGTYGTNGFYLPFTDNSGATATTIGKDFSGNGNNWTPNNISITAGVTYDSMTDVPTLTSATAANFAVLNPLKSYYTPTNGNLSMSTGSSVTGLDVASIGLGTGVKFYFEATATGTAEQIGIFSSNHALTPTGSKRYWYVESGGLYNDGTLLQSVATFTSGDTIAVAWDGTAQTVTFYKNNTQQGTAISVDTSYSYFFGVGAYNGGWNVNFGQRPFLYTPPTGFVALNTFNLPTSTIVKGNTVMDATLYSGNNAATQTIVNAAGFQPDAVWLKCRSTVDSWGQVDSVRGVNKLLQSNNTNAEITAGSVTAFNSNGFTADLNFNVSGRTYVGYQWQAGKGTTSTNTSGTITSTVSVNASAGFSIVTYSGSTPSGTVGHGLGVTPSMIIVKQRNAAGNNWPVWISGTTSATQFLFFNGVAAIATSTNFWNSTLPTSSVFSVGNDSATNTTGSTYVAYCWAAIAGFSSFGSFTGNSNADGPFVYLGFRPKYVTLRRTDDTGNWLVFDAARDPYNTVVNFLRTNASDAESTGVDVALDFLSNGFKIRQTSGNINAGNIVYMAFAENPFKNSLAR